MAYRFDRDFATVQDGVRKIAVELIDEAIECADKRRDLDDAVHTARKSCKKLRGLIRLVRPVFKDYQDENAAFRDAGRGLSVLRDAGVLIETYDDLLKEYREQVDRSKFAAIRRRLTSVQKEVAARDDVGDMLDAFSQNMVQARKRAARWSVEADGFDALEPGVRKGYKRAQRAMAAAAKDPTPESVHEWRKRVKDHWYQSRLLSPIWRKPMTAHAEVADQLGDLLGKHHDLEVFRQKLADKAFNDVSGVEVLVGLVRRRQRAIEEEAFTIGAPLLAEAPDSLTRRWRSYWETWHKDEPREAALAA